MAETLGKSRLAKFPLRLLLPLDGQKIHGVADGCKQIQPCRSIIVDAQVCETEHSAIFIQQRTTTFRTHAIPLCRSERNADR